MVEGHGLPRSWWGTFWESLRSSLFRNSFFLLTTTGLGGVSGLLFWSLVGRFFTPEEFGLGYALLAVLMLLASAATLGLNVSVIRFLPGERDKAGLINAALLVTAGAALLLGLAFLGGLDLWAPSLLGVRSDPLVAAACLAVVVGLATGSIVDASLVAARRADYGTIRTAVFGFLRLPFPILLAGGMGLLGIVASWDAALLVSLVVAAFVLLRRAFPGYRPSFTVARIRGEGVLGYSLWNYAASLVGAVPGSLLPLVIVNTGSPGGGAAASGYYSIAAAVASVLYVVPGAFSTSLFVEGSHTGADYRRNTRHAILYSLALLGLGIVLIVFLGRWALSLIGPSFADNGYAPLVLMGLAGPIVLANLVYSTHLRVANRVRPLVWVAAVSSVFTLVLASQLLPGWGIVGAAAAFVAGQALCVPLYWWEQRSNGHTA